MGVGDRLIDEPLLYQQPLAQLGVILPEAGGLREVVNWLCVVKLAVYVAAVAGVVIVWLCVPPSDQEE